MEEDDFLDRVDRYLMPETAAGTAGIVGASMLPVVGDTIDVADIGFGIRNRDPARVGFGLLGLALGPLAGGAALRQFFKKRRGAKPQPDTEREQLLLPRTSSARPPRSGQIAMGLPGLWRSHSLDTAARAPKRPMTTKEWREYLKGKPGGLKRIKEWLDAQDMNEEMARDMQSRLPPGNPFERITSQGPRKFSRDDIVEATLEDLEPERALEYTVLSMDPVRNAFDRANRKDLYKPLFSRGFKDFIRENLDHRYKPRPVGENTWDWSLAQKDGGIRDIPELETISNLGGLTKEMKDYLRAQHYPLDRFSFGSVDDVLNYVSYKGLDDLASFPERLAEQGVQTSSADKTRFYELVKEISEAKQFQPDAYGRWEEAEKNYNRFSVPVNRSLRQRQEAGKLTRGDLKEGIWSTRKARIVDEMLAEEMFGESPIESVADFLRRFDERLVSERGIREGYTVKDVLKQVDLIQRGEAAPLTVSKMINNRGLGLGRTDIDREAARLTKSRDFVDSLLDLDPLWGSQRLDGNNFKSVFGMDGSEYEEIVISLDPNKIRRADLRDMGDDHNYYPDIPNSFIQVRSTHRPFAIKRSPLYSARVSPDLAIGSPEEELRARWRSKRSADFRRAMDGSIDPETGRMPDPILDDVYFVEEIQSPVHQYGFKHGYSSLGHGIEDKKIAQAMEAEIKAIDGKVAQLQKEFNPEFDEIFFGDLDEDIQKKMLSEFMNQPEIIDLLKRKRFLFDELEGAPETFPFKEPAEWGKLAIRTALQQAARKGAKGFAIIEPDLLRYSQPGAAAEEANLKWYGETLPNILRKEAKRLGIKIEEGYTGGPRLERLETHNFNQALENAGDWELQGWQELDESAPVRSTTPILILNDEARRKILENIQSFKHGGLVN